MRCSISSLVAAAALAAIAGCAQKEKPLDPSAVTCLAHARGVGPPPYADSRLAIETARADAFAACMSAQGFVYDEAAADERLRKFEQKLMFDLWAGDPFAKVQLQRQQLRLTPDLWRRAAG